MPHRNNLTVCLFTSSKGHFKRDTYQRTVTSLLQQIPASSWGALLAHIKTDSGEEAAAKAKEMSTFLREQGFQGTATVGDWSHGNETHQHGYLSDLIKLTGFVTTPYVLVWEDDWLVRVNEHDLEYWLSLGVRLLEEDPSLIQVRIPRYSNELDRILGLKAKHNIDGKAMYHVGESKWFAHSDWSMNPCIVRTRDLRAGLTLVAKTSLPKHVEAGLGAAMKILSWNASDMPFACFNPDMIRCGHIGVATEAEEDNLDKPLIAT